MEELFYFILLEVVRLGAQLTYENWGKDLPVFPIGDPLKGSLRVLEWAYSEYEDDLVYACSFGAEGMVLIDLISKVKPDAQVVFLDTGLHFKETYDVINQVKKRYPELRIEMAKPDLSVAEQAEQYGEALWERQPNQCCNLRKIIPLERALASATAWLSGLRRDQSPSRQFTQFVNKDDRFSSIKVCPLIHWTWDDVWAYIRRENLPYNALHDQGYPSIGCDKCTLAVKEGQDHRAGRWVGSQKTECGLHVQP
ncbi:phosphoadenylyl-sulfate reductase [Marininema mesophilum]|uniref:phosphoadenylyl-sulfate reductase n=1 Tax=Marininema mesophilum TaxID=1048340 RepID=UPI000B8A009F|nr:phosphoadenylyl-sulfate reductase [Marininema mesophilum]